MKSSLLLSFLILFTSCSTKSPSESRSLAAVSSAEVKIAAVNFKVKGGHSLEQHLQRIDEFAQKARAQSVDYLLLPELMQFDLLPVNPTSAELPAQLDRLAKTSAEYEKALVEMSLRHDLNIIGASVMVKEKGKFINRAFFINPEGKVLYQDKVHPTPWERQKGFVGGKEIKHFKTDDFSFVILICHDAEFPTISSALVKQKPEVIFVPSQTDDLNGLRRVKYTSAARSIEHMAYVLMTGTAGEKNAPWHSFIGQNMFFRPANNYFPEGFSYGNQNVEELSVYTLDLSKLRQARKDAKQVYPARDLSR